METSPELGTTEFEDKVTEWMDKEAFKVAPRPRAPVYIDPKILAFLEEIFARNAIQEWNNERKLEFQQNNLKRSTKPFYLNAPIGRRRR